MACLLVGIVGFPASVPGETVTLPPVADTALFELEPDFNFGEQTTLPIGTLAETPADRARSRGLFRFDVASHVPEGSEIEFASLQLTVVRSPPNAASASFSLHRMLRTWREGDKAGGRPGGDEASDGESTWSHRGHPDEAWGSPGGEAGVDFETDPTSSERVAFETEYNLELGRQGIQAIQEWIAEPASNFGWLLKTEAEETARTARRFASREHSSSPPKLSIHFIPPADWPAPPRIRDIAVDDDQIRIRFRAEQAVAYSLEMKPNIRPETAWETLESLPRTDADRLVELIAPKPEGATNQAFYRIRGK